ncbi:MAG: hypothetical protein A3C85_03995 [Candidatus Doudnabacteria bacterium RIFCSPHIGHO2_02_FULL_48_21]|uniref:Capsule polysaccharide biosynthesis protein n=1 Tax=Candidatus Doudnabacteria bacterium RIFCSPLOWO2_02_FULL_48_13 TaxID=1817845 RepID=A0A1F5QAU0_9BACT|nr:MAG: hypothetical protein A3K05_03965 [Candidatus Doudnabacteria bacterium RIFCSPHIGHO2_01_48_18]OGE91170.1 MAG: hypothetical protein A3F44_02475 [Candidatus Doudnabacteria bacterium RIFCSPHIGHO2_12_FULL_47_25]OGE93618.1 MAG: hypothetical protein A3C85_03995 [Candidatus Doudnabacteria bacterium RIFCSPHIGHO2_02_FULL_48_21]OGE99314.1 MAG: hypothetical protein A3J05_00135 [Candidatus Doudnabacteria bacterium RIFCSPLOWO2_02_FULL_48_13]OGF01720.1 MAG: hypothetical protein A3G07_01330 [Candidatus 
MSKFSGKKILIFQQRGWSKRIGNFLARKLQDENAVLAALTQKRSAHDFLLKQKDIRYEKIYSIDEVRGNPRGYLDGTEFTLEEICEALGVDSIWPMVMSLRHHIRTYGEKYYYSFKQNVSDEEIIAYVKALYKLIATIHNEFKPDIVVLPNFVSLPHLMFDRYAVKHGIKMLAVSDSKVHGIGIFVHNQQEDTGTFFERLAELNTGKVVSKNQERARQYIAEFREKFKRPVYSDHLYKKHSWLARIKQELSPYYYSLRWLLDPKRKIDYLPNLGPTIDYRPPWIKLRDHYARKRYTKFMKNFVFYPLEKLDKYIYFPLQSQPETTIDVRAPFFANQIETARLVAMSLPDDYTLVVKEHPWMIGKRPPSYIEKIARTPNVKLIDWRIPSEKVLRGAAAVVGPSCTTLAEAAFYHKPAVQLGNLGTTLMLPNTFKHSDMTVLAPRIKELLRLNLKTQEYEQRLENYVAAAFDEGFDFNYWGVWERSEKDNMEKLWAAYQKQLERLV